MSCGSLLKGMFSYLFLALIVSLFLYPISGNSEVFNVTNEDELREALSIAESNGEDDIINIEAGLYRTFGEPFTFESDENYSLALEGEGAGITILDGDGLSRVLSIQTITGAPRQSQFPVTLEDLTIQNGSNQSRGRYLDMQGGGVFIYSAESVTINKCNFIDNTTHGQGGGVYISAVNMYLNGNEFSGNLSGNSGGGLSVYGQEVSNVSLINNIFAQNTSLSGYRGGAGALSILGGEKVNIINNTITMNYSGEDSSALVLEIPIEQYDGVDNVTNIYNNITIANDISNGSDILVRGQPFPVPTAPPTGFPSPVTIDYGTVNLFNNDVFFFKVENPYECSWQEITCLLEINEGDNIIADPLFVNAEAGDFSLQPNSPCIDTGDPNAPDVPDTDIFGNIRVAPPDMGAVEYIEEAIQGGGGCSIAHNPVSSSLAVFLALPALILIRRIAKRYKS